MITRARPRLRLFDVLWTVLFFISVTLATLMICRHRSRAARENRPVTLLAAASPDGIASTRRWSSGRRDYPAVEPPAVAEASAPFVAEARVGPAVDGGAPTYDARPERAATPEAAATATASPAASEDVPERLSGRVAFFDSALDAQRPDPAWANVLGDSIRAQYEGMDGVTVDGVKCGQTLCRFEMATTGDDTSGQKAMSRLSKVPGLTGELTARMTAPPLPPKVVIYVAWPLTQLPSPSD
ncbi:MAG TPA: hypothetical protein VIF57_32295 [Polyangia bacterium]|jgi:hypothetical protein